jgi:hypothetical protein
VGGGALLFVTGGLAAPALAAALAAAGVGSAATITLASSAVSVCTTDSSVPFGLWCECYKYGICDAFNA